jgi:putative transposase
MMIFLRTAVKTAIHSALEAEMTEALSAERSERVDARLGYRSGFYSRSLITRVGTIELRVPHDRSGLFSIELFERYQRSERALVSALAEMYVRRQTASTSCAPVWPRPRSATRRRCAATNP